MGVFKRWIKSKDGKNTPYWYIRFAMNGKMKWESVGKVGVATKDVARSKLDERKRQVRLGQLDVIVAKIPTLSEYKCDYIRYVKDVKGNRSWRSTIHYLNQLEKLFGDKKLSQISSRDVDNYKLTRIQEVKPSSVNRELACLSHLFNFAKRENKFFGSNPVSVSKLLPENNQIDRILTPEEEFRLISACSGRLRPIIITALNTGTRKGEIITA